MADRTAEDYGRAAVALPGFRWAQGMSWANSDHGTDGVIEDDVTAQAWTMGAWDGDTPDIDNDATAGAMEPLLGADLVIWDNREGLRGIHVLWPDGDHFYAHCETKGRGLVLAAEYRKRWDGGC